MSGISVLLFEFDFDDGESSGEICEIYILIYKKIVEIFIIEIDVMKENLIFKLHLLINTRYF
jgi:hypothetical protein